jgi:hypothetical protein
LKNPFGLYRKWNPNRSMGEFLGKHRGDLYPIICANSVQKEGVYMSNNTFYTSAISAKKCIA